MDWFIDKKKCDSFDPNAFTVYSKAGSEGEEDVRALGTFMRETILPSLFKAMKDSLFVYYDTMNITRDLHGQGVNLRYLGKLADSCTDADIEFRELIEEEMIARFRRTPPEELFKVDKVRIELGPGDMPGKPYTTTFCSVCGEKVSDGRHVLRGGRPVCRSCAEESYYELIED